MSLSQNGYGGGGLHRERAPAKHNCGGTSSAAVTESGKKVVSHTQARNRRKGKEETMEQQVTEDRGLDLEQGIRRHGRECDASTGVALRLEVSSIWLRHIVVQGHVVAAVERPRCVELPAVLGETRLSLAVVWCLRASTAGQGLPRKPCLRPQALARTPWRSAKRRCSHRLAQKAKTRPYTNPQ